MANSSPRRLGRAFTLIEVIVVLGVIAVMMSITYPLYLAMSQRAKATKDMSNLRQIGILVQTYLNDKDQILPASTIWPGTSPAPVLYPKYVATTKIFQSPFDKRTPSEASDGSAPVSYSINHNLYDATIGITGNMLKVVSPASTFFMAPNYNGDPRNASSWQGTAGNAPDLPVGGAGETRGTHNNGRQIEVLFCDFHTETVAFCSSPCASPPTGSFQDTTSNVGQKHWNPTQ